MRRRRSTVVYDTEFAVLESWVMHCFFCITWPVSFLLDTSPCARKGREGRVIRQLQIVQVIVLLHNYHCFHHPYPLVQCNAVLSGNDVIFHEFSQGFKILVFAQPSTNTTLTKWFNLILYMSWTYEDNDADDFVKLMIATHFNSFMAGFQNLTLR